MKSTNFNFDDVLQINSVSNSMLIQSQDDLVFKKKDFKVVSKKKPNKIQFENLLFAFNISRHVKSNAIVLVGDKTTVGIGSGQPSRLDSCQIAINKMRKFKKNEKEIVAASDAFFPFVDGEGIEEPSLCCVLGHTLTILFYLRFFELFFHI